jgi:hypothetical protein
MAQCTEDANCGTFFGNPETCIGGVCTYDCRKAIGGTDHGSPILCAAPKVCEDVILGITDCSRDKVYPECNALGDSYNQGCSCGSGWVCNSATETCKPTYTDGTEVTCRAIGYEPIPRPVAPYHTCSQSAQTRLQGINMANCAVQAVYQGDNTCADLVGCAVGPDPATGKTMYVATSTSTGASAKCNLTCAEAP